MNKRHYFSPLVLDSVLGGKSIIDAEKLNIKNLEEAYEFIETYGYDLHNESDREEVWNIYHRAINLLINRFLDKDMQIYPKFATQESLQDPAQLLISASLDPSAHFEEQAWACAILRVMHALSHMEDDFFYIFSEQITQSIFKPFYDHIYNDPIIGTTLGLKDDTDRIKLHKFEVKRNKSEASGVIKLMAKPDFTAHQIYDRVGVRFITRTVYDSLRVVRFLVDEHIISLPNVMPDQSRNTLYPINLFYEVVNEVEKKDVPIPPEEVDALLQEKLKNSLDRAEFLEKQNYYSGTNFRSIKFIVRKMIEVNIDNKKSHFFFPYEVQVLDYETHRKNLSGPEAHEQYKKRQLEAAKLRILGAIKKRANLAKDA